MKQILQDFKTGEMLLEEVPAPMLGEDAVLVATRASLISAGTEKMLVNLARKSLIGKARERPDQVRKILAKVRTEGLRATIQKVEGQLSVPLPLGYSAVGTVIATGAHVTDLRPGQMVACAGAKYANHAEVIAVPRNLCVPVPPGVPPEEACYVTLGAIALQGVRLAEPTLGETFLVTGLGLLGQLAVQLLKTNGCRVIAVDLDAEKVALAERLGADFGAAGSAAARSLVPSVTHGRGVDGVVITAATDSNDPIELAGEVCRLKGRVVAVGAVRMDIPRKTYYEKELDLRVSRSYGPGRYDPAYEEHGQDYPLAYVRWTEQRNMEAFLDLLAARRLDAASLTTHTVPIEEALQAYEMICGPTPVKYLGIVLRYPDSEPRLREVVPLAGPAHPASSGAVRIGLIGAGAFARGTLLPALKKSPDVQFRGIATSTGATSASVGKRQGFAFAAPDAAAVIADAETDAVLIATRHGAHADLAAEALYAGKHVFVEKPLAIDAGQLARVADAARASGRLLMVGYNRRFAPLARQMRDYLAERNAPMLLSVRVNAGRIPAEHWIQHPREGGGRLIGEACHFVDLIQFLTGENPVRVSTAGALDGDAPAQDNSVTTLHLSGGSIATILYTAGGDAAFPKERVEAFAGGAVAVLDDFRALTTVRGGRTKTTRSGQDKGHAAGIGAFLDAVREGGPAPIPFESLWETTATTLAMIESLATGETVGVRAAGAGMGAEGGADERAADADA